VNSYQVGSKYVEYLMKYVHVGGFSCHIVLTGCEVLENINTVKIISSCIHMVEIALGRGYAYPRLNTTGLTDTGDQTSLSILGQSMVTS
jgi:hypothetical protein